MTTYETQRAIERAEERLLVLRERLRQQTVEQRQPHPPPDPEDQIQGYPWPSSALTRADMIRLTELRRTTRKPITKLLHEAVAALYALIAGTRKLQIVPWHGEAGSLWYVIDAEAPTDDHPCVLATAHSIEEAQAILRTLTNMLESSPQSR